MARRGLRRAARGAAAGALAAALAACEGEACIVPPCVPPVALTLTVTSAASGAPVAATVRYAGRGAGETPCGGACAVPGTSGTYDLEVSAPGYQTARRSVVVRGGEPASRCGCPVVETERVAIALVPAA